MCFLLPDCSVTSLSPASAAGNSADFQQQLQKLKILKLTDTLNEISISFKGELSPFPYIP